MRAFLGAVSVEVQVRFAGDLLHATELNVAQVEKCYQVGLATTAQLPLPLPPFSLLRVTGDRLELCVPDSMQAQLADGAQVAERETVVVRWQAVEIAVVPSPPSRAHSWRRRRAWPVELLSSSAATVVGLLALFPAALLLLALGGRSTEDHPTRAARIVYMWRDRAGAPAVPAEKVGAPPPKAATREARPKTPPATAKTAQAAAPALRGRESGDADAPTHDDDSGFAGSAAADGALAQQSHADRALAQAREVAARTGIIGVLDGRVQIAASAAAVDPAGASDFVLELAAKNAGGGAAGGSGSPGGASSSGSPASGSKSGATSNDSGAASNDSGAASNDSGALQGSDVGEAFGEGGLGLVGSGAGGGGADEGTIGLGDLGTIGHGGGSGTGSGYGYGYGGLGGHRAYAPDVHPGGCELHGALDKEMIRRVIRRHLNEVRFCYESALQNAPELAGRVRVDFVILPDGSVATSSAAESTLADPAVGECTARAFSRWQFPSAHRGGVTIVHYPFDFVPAGQ